MIDVAEGEKIPRKGGPGITRSDLLVINKIDLAPYVGADLAVMDRDARRMRGERPFVFTNLRTGEGAETIVSWIRRDLLLDARREAGTALGAASVATARCGSASRGAAATVLAGCRFTLPLQVLAPMALDDPAAVVSILNPDRWSRRRRPARRSTSGRRGRPRVRSRRPRPPASIARGEPTVQTVRSRSGPRAVVEWVPDHTIPFAGSALRQAIDVELDDGAPAHPRRRLRRRTGARGEAWRFALLESAISFRRPGGWLLHDRSSCAGDAEGRSRVRWDRVYRVASVLRLDRGGRRIRPRPLRGGRRSLDASGGATMGVARVAAPRCPRPLPGVERARVVPLDAVAGCWPARALLGLPPLALRKG